VKKATAAYSANMFSQKYLRCIHIYFINASQLSSDRMVQPQMDWDQDPGHVVAVCVCSAHTHIVT